MNFSNCLQVNFWVCLIWARQTCAKQSPKTCYAHHHSDVGLGFRLHPSCSFPFPFPSDLHVYMLEGFFSPSGEISCPRLSFCRRDIKDETQLLLPTLSLSTTKEFLVGRCFLLVVIIILKLFVVSSQPVLMLASFFFDYLNGLVFVSFFLRLTVFRGLCSLQRQFVRLQSTGSWCSYSSGSAGADCTTGRMQTNPEIMQQVPSQRLKPLWLCWTAADSVARRVTSSQEDPKWPHQRPPVHAH